MWKVFPGLTGINGLYQKGECRSKPPNDSFAFQGGKRNGSRLVIHLNIIERETERNGDLYFADSAGQLWIGFDGGSDNAA
jgi:hypothetical protein